MPMQTDITSNVPSIEQYVPISIVQLFDHQVLPFPVYVLDREKDRMVLFCEEGGSFRKEHVLLLTENGKHPVYIPTGFAAHLNRTLSKNLTSVMENENLSVQDKTERFHAISTTLMKSLFESPPDLDTFIQTASVVSDNLSGLIAAGPQVIGNLTRLRTFDYYTYSHSMNVTALTVGFYHQLEPESPEARMKELTRGVLLHDIGKCDIPKEILNKKGKLDEDEWTIMKSHTTLGYDKLRADEGLSEDSRLVALHHHEAYDGSGYPYGLAGEAIPYTSRICKLCDVYDALTSKRSYKDKQSPFDSLQFMKSVMHGQFDAALMHQFIGFLGKVYNLDSGNKLP